MRKWTDTWLGSERDFRSDAVPGMRTPGRSRAGGETMKLQSWIRHSLAQQPKGGPKG